MYFFQFIVMTIASLVMAFVTWLLIAEFNYEYKCEGLAHVPKIIAMMLSVVGILVSICSTVISSALAIHFIGKMTGLFAIVCD